MPDDPGEEQIAVFDIGGTWFRWGIYSASHGLRDCQRVPAINYLSHPTLCAEALQAALVEFLIRCVHDLRHANESKIRTVCVSLGAPMNAHDMTVLGSGPLWGPTAKSFQLHTRLQEALPDLHWHVINDVTALLAPYMDDGAACRKTMIITVSSGIGSRLYDHRFHTIPYDTTHGVQGEIGHLVFPFELDGKLLRRQCECGGWNHMNAFASGRGIAQTLLHLPALSTSFGEMFSDSPESWQKTDDQHRLIAFQAQVELGNASAINLLDAFVTPLSRALAATLSLDPEIDRIVITGGVAQGLGEHYREALRRTFLREGLYQITERDPDYLMRRLRWEASCDFSGLRGAGVFALKTTNEQRATASMLPGRPDAAAGTPAQMRN